MNSVLQMSAIAAVRTFATPMSVQANSSRSFATIAATASNQNRLCRLISPS